MNLTESQRRAIEHVGRNLQLIACAGSGKTEVVAWRECQRDGLVNEVVQGALKLILEPIFDGSPDPTTQGWQNTIGRMATQIQKRNVEVTWNDFLDSLLSVLPRDLLTHSQVGSG